MAAESNDPSDQEVLDEIEKLLEIKVPPESKRD
jgi:hypothetical protein